MDTAGILALLSWPLVALAATYVLAFRPWRWRRLPRAFFPSLDLLMVAAMAGGVVALHHPAPLERAAGALVEWTSLPVQMDSIDREIHELQTLPQRTWQSIKEELGLDGDELDPIPPPPDPGPVRASVLPAVQDLVAMVLRFGAYGTSLGLMGVALVMRLWFMRSRRRWDARTSDRASLEERIRDLEQAVRGLSAPAGSALLS